MNLYLDTEFLEGKQDQRFLGIKYGETKPTIDLISIALVSEDNIEYYAISKDFNLREAWNRYDLKHEQVSGDMRNQFSEGITKKVYWIRENVLRPIFNELLNPVQDSIDNNYRKFTYRNFKYLIKKYGKTNSQIAQEIFEFCSGDVLTIEKAKFYNKEYDKVSLYGYYSAYDHVVFSWLFGKMINLPSLFPMFTIDIKQILDDTVIVKDEKQFYKVGGSPTILKATYDIKKHPNYPQQENEHNALADARWNKKLHEFLKSI